MRCFTKAIYFGLLALGACTGPEWSYHQAVNCQQGGNDLAVLEGEHSRINDLVAEKKLSASDLVTPDEKAKVLLGNGYDDPREFFLVNWGQLVIPGGMANASEVTVLDYTQALELRSNMIRTTCQIERPE